MQLARQATLALLAAGIALAGSTNAGGEVTQRIGGGSQASHAGRNYQALTASCTASIKVPNVHVAGTNSYIVVGSLTNACGAVDASWDMVQGAQRVSGWFFWNGGTTTLSSGQTDNAYYYPGIDPLGTYQASPSSADDTNYQPISQNAYQFYIKVDSRISVSGYRSGKVVYLRALVRRFSSNANWGLGGWVNSSGRIVVFYQNRIGWRRVAARATGQNGYTSYLKIYTPTRRLFRATVSATPSIWDRTSAPISR
jgi:hypothetical protein